MDIPVKILAHDKRETKGTVRLEQFNPSQRLKRAFKFLGLYWALAILSVFVPIAHFVLVPGFFITGIAAFALVYANRSVILGGKGICPYCAASLPIVRMADKWPLTDKCAACHRNLTLERLT